MRIIKKTLTLMAMLLLSIASFAIPANPQPITVKQPNGKTLTFILQGDERVSWAKTLDNYTLLPNKSGNMVYAVLNENGDLVCSDVLACNQEERSVEENQFLANIEPGLFFSKEQVKIKKQGFAAQAGLDQEGPLSKYPTTGVDSLLVILVSFSDLNFTYTNQDFVDLTCQSNYANYGSVKDYYLEQSDSVFEMAIRVVGPYTLPNSMEYYGGHTTYYGYDMHDKNITYFVRDAINAADPDVNFTHFDNDGDGKVDGIHIIFAGTPESSTGNPNEIWPHRGEVNSSIVKDGVRFTAYSCSAEKRNAYQMDNIGTICHEFGHVLGLPDDYDTDYEQSGGNAQTTGDWDVMCQGSYNNNSATPPRWSTWQQSLTNWVNKIDTLDVNNGQDSLIVRAVTGKQDTCYYIALPNNQFFWIEARKKGGWDSFIPGSGMIVYHGNQTKINSWSNEHSNTINVNPSDRGWFIEPADGNINHINTGYAPFPGTSNTHYFTADSPNHTRLADGITIINNVAITDIYNINDSTLMFNFNSSLPMVTTGSATNVGLYNFNTTGNILYTGQGSLQSKGVVYSTSSDFTFESGTKVYDNSTGNSISVALEGLERGTLYYYRAFAVSTSGTAMGDLKQQETRSGLGTVVTMGATNIDSTSATIRGNMTYTGMAEFISKGFVYTSDPDITPDKENATVITFEDSTLGQFTYNLTDLEQGGTYYVRAFVTNGFGTSYGIKNSFQTLFPAINDNQISSNQQICKNTTPAQITGTTPTGGFGNFTYLWQQRDNVNTSWTAAEGVNDQINYQPQALENNTYFRRIVTSDGKVNHTSNNVYIEVRVSVGGNINFAFDTVLKNSTHPITLSGHTGSIVDWELSADNENTFQSLNTTANPYNETFGDTGSFVYRAKVQINQCPSAYSSTRKIVVKDGSSIMDINPEGSFQVMPNPSSNGFFVITSDIEDAKLTITNILGQVVYQENNADLRNKVMNLDLENGSYLINVSTQNNSFSSKLIIEK